MPIEIGEYKAMADGLAEGGFTDSQTQALVDVVAGVVSRLRDEMHDGFRALNERLDGVDKRLDGVDEHLRQIDNRLDRVDERLDRVDERFARIDERLDRVDERFDRVDERFDRLDDRFDRLYDRFDSLKSWLIGGLGMLNVTLIGAIVALAVRL